MDVIGNAFDEEYRKLERGVRDESKLPDRGLAYRSFVNFALQRAGESYEVIEE